MKCPECGAQVKVEGRGECPYCEAPVEQASLADPLAAVLEDRDGDGIPNIVQSMLKPGAVRNVSVTAKTTVSQRYVVNGIEYHSLEEMPPEARQAIAGAAGLLGGALVHGGGSAAAEVPSATTSSVSKSAVVTKPITTNAGEGRGSDRTWAAFLIVAIGVAALAALYAIASRS